MATLIKESLDHDHAGARWIVPFLAVMVAMVLFAFAMLGYAYL